VVGNRIGNLPEFIEHGVNGLLTERTLEGLTEALIVLAADIPRAISMGLAARQTVEREWTWKRMANNYAQMWKDVLTRETV